MSDNHQQQPSHTVTLLASEWMVIRAGLAELPLKLSLPVLGKVEQQIMAQQQPVPEQKEVRHEPDPTAQPDHPIPAR